MPAHRNKSDNRIRINRDLWMRLLKQCDTDGLPIDYVIHTLIVLYLKGGLRISQEQIAPQSIPTTQHEQNETIRAILSDDLFGNLL